jgi:acyl-coenzyme A thioesterase PaaI-like protein
MADRGYALRMGTRGTTMTELRPASADGDADRDGLHDEERTIRLVAEVRELIGAVRVADAPSDTIDEALDLVRRAGEVLAPHRTLATTASGAVGTGDPAPQRTRPTGWRLGDEFPYSPVTGLRNAISPPLDMRFDGERVRARTAFDLRYAGPPGSMHGGVAALVLDELLGTTNYCHGVGARTGTLSVRYERPTPIGVDLDLEGWLDRVEGRKVFTVGTISHDGMVTVRAEGVFILSA